MRRKLICLTLIVSLASASADEQVRATQEELRRRHIYFGDVDGRTTPELQEAVKRYQRRKGFSTSGQVDPDTLRSLGLLARQPGEAPPREVSWPDEPVLKSDVRIDARQEAGRVAEESGVVPASIFPLVAISDGGVPSEPRRDKAKSSRSAGAAGGGPVVETAAPRRSFLRGRSGQTDQIVDDGELRAFVAGYFRAASGGDLQKELRFYADRVNYFHTGGVDRRIIERTLRDFYQRWPQHRYRLVGPVQYHRDTKRGVIIAVCRVEFAQKRGRTVAKGQTETRLVINAATSDPRIVQIDERRVRGG